MLANPVPLSTDFLGDNEVAQSSFSSVGRKQPKWRPRQRIRNSGSTSEADTPRIIESRLWIVLLLKPREENPRDIQLEEGFAQGGAGSDVLEENHKP